MKLSFHLAALVLSAALVAALMLPVLYSTLVVL